MKAVFVLLAVIIPATFCFYARPNYQSMPQRVNTRGVPSLDDFFQNLHLPGKRCANLFDESCINGNMQNAGSDEGFLTGGGTPGKRCVNTFDESCANGGINGAGSDEEWLTGGSNPGRR